MNSLSGHSFPHVFEITKKEDRISINSQLFHSLKVESEHSNFVLLPTFPKNFPKVIQPTMFTDREKHDTLKACRVFCSEEVEEYYNNLFSTTWPSPSKASEACDIVKKWKKEETMKSVYPTYKCGDILAVYGEGGKVWFAQVKRPKKDNLLIQWYEKDEKKYKLGREDVIPVGSVIMDNIKFTSKMKLSPESQQRIGEQKKILKKGKELKNM